MKKLMVTICLVASFSAYAQSEKACRVYEFAELNTYSDAELNTLYKKYSDTYSSIKAQGMPSNSRDLSEYFDDTKNCSEEKERIGRLVESRKSKAEEKIVKMDKKITKIKKSDTER